MQWIKTDQVQSGDIIETISKIPEHSPVCKGMMLPIIKHYGIVCSVDGEQCLVHNIIGRTPTITPIDEVFVDRKIERVLRTGMCDQEILSKYEQVKDRPYRLWDFNCENLMVFISGSSIGFPQQAGWTIGVSTFVVVSVILLVLIFRKGNN